jgi:hypothetical protein
MGSTAYNWECIREQITFHIWQVLSWVSSDFTFLSLYITECGDGILPLTASEDCLMFESNLHCNRVSEGCIVATTKLGHLQNHRWLSATDKTERRDAFKFSSMCQHRGLCHNLISRNTRDELTLNNDNSKSNSKFYATGEMWLYVPTVRITAHGHPLYLVQMYIYVYMKQCCILEYSVLICKEVD